MACQNSIWTGSVGRLEGVGRAQRGVDLGVAALRALAASTASTVVAAATGRGDEGEHREEHQDQGGSLHGRHPFTAPAVRPRTR